MTIKEQDIGGNGHHDQFVDVIEHYLDYALKSYAATSPYFLLKTDIPLLPVTASTARMNFCAHHSIQYACM